MFALLRYIFRSRWWAMAWAAGICWIAVQVAGGKQTSGGGLLNISATTNAIAAALPDY